MLERSSVLESICTQTEHTLSSPISGESLRCPWSRTTARNKRMYFRYFESMGFHQISMKRKFFCSQNVGHTTVTGSITAIFPKLSTEAEKAESPDVYLLSEVVDNPLFHKPIRTNQISFFPRPSVHFDKLTQIKLHSQRPLKISASANFCLFPRIQRFPSP